MSDNLHVRNIIGLCRVEAVRTADDVWEVWLWAEVKLPDGRTEIWTFTVSDNEWFRLHESRDQARHQRDLVVWCMAKGKPIWIHMTLDKRKPAEMLYAQRDFGWSIEPRRFKVKAKRK